MARRPQAEAEAPPEGDRLPGFAHPRQTVALHGLEAAEQALLGAWRSGRMHHAWILHGPTGIGKATLAYRFAAFLLSHATPHAAAHPGAGDADRIALDEAHQGVRLVRAGSHPDLLAVRRTWDERSKRMRVSLPIDEVRKVAEFFALTPAYGGWRVAIVDTADDMNINAANALLKILEEPPANALILLISNTPERLLATIRSRCRALAVAPPGEAGLIQVLRDAGAGGAFDGLDERRRSDLLALAGGSPRAALELLSSGGLDLHGAIEDILARWPAIDLGAVHGLADKVARRGADQEFAFTLDALSRWLERGLQGEGAGQGSRPANLAQLAEVWEKIGRLRAEAETFRFDRRQVLVKAFREIAELGGAGAPGLVSSRVSQP